MNIQKTHEIKKMFSLSSETRDGKGRG